MSPPTPSPTHNPRCSLRLSPIQNTILEFALLTYPFVQRNAFLHFLPISYYVTFVNGVAFLDFTINAIVRPLIASRFVASGMRNGFLTLNQRAQCGVPGTRRATLYISSPLPTSLELLIMICS